MVAQEREAQQRILRGKDELIEKLSEFIKNAKDAMTTEFKAVSGDVLRNASDQLSKTADEIIKQHGERTSGSVELHKKQIETMLKPVEESMKRLDQHVESTNRARSAAETLLDEQIKRLAGASESLSNALLKPVVRGSWGEMTLENSLQSAKPRSRC